MIVVPASTAACAGIAQGLSKDLLQRAADVNLKERRPVVVVPRETPASRSHLVHLLSLHDAGATVLRPLRVSTRVRRSCNSSSTSWPAVSWTPSASSIRCTRGGVANWAEVSATTADYGSSGEAVAEFSLQERTNLGFTEPSVATGSADAADPPRSRPTGYRFRVDPKQRGDFHQE